MRRQKLVFGWGMESWSLHIWDSRLKGICVTHKPLLTFAHSLLRAHLIAILHGVQGEVNLGYGPFLVHRAINVAHSVHRWGGEL